MKAFVTWVKDALELAEIALWAAVYIGAFVAAFLFLREHLQGIDEAARVEAHRVMCAELGQEGLEGVARGEYSVKDALSSMRRNGC